MYILENTERNNSRASEYETKSLLYLIGIHNKRDDISLLFIDCFNDITGSNNEMDILLDVQSKGVSNLTPRKIGESLITLFKNYNCEIDFAYYILVTPQISSRHLIDNSLKEFDINNFVDISKIELGLRTKHLSQNTDILDLNLDNKIEDFLSETCFVIADNPKDFYVKNIIEFNKYDTKSKEFYDNIFNEIRDKQTALKNIYVEGKKISTPLDVKNLNKYISSEEIKVLLINRVIGVDLFQGVIPTEYFDEIKHLEKEGVAYLIQGNEEKISRTIFNKNNKVPFWKLLEIMVNKVNQNMGETPRDIFNRINGIDYKKILTLDDNSIIFLISLIQRGVCNVS